MHMVSNVATRNVINLKQAISSQISTYKSRGYVVTYMLVDNESEQSHMLTNLESQSIRHQETNMYLRWKEHVGLLKNASVQSGIRNPTS